VPAGSPAVITTDNGNSSRVLLHDVDQARLRRRGPRVLLLLRHDRRGRCVRNNKVAAVAPGAWDQEWRRHKIGPRRRRAAMKSRGLLHDEAAVTPAAAAAGRWIE
jgi:hypothetical protein